MLRLLLALHWQLREQQILHGSGADYSDNVNFGLLVNYQILNVSNYNNGRRL